MNDVNTILVLIRSNKNPLAQKTFTILNVPIDRLIQCGIYVKLQNVTAPVWRNCSVAGAN
jgi:hypothetical protein